MSQDLAPLKEPPTPEQASRHLENARLKAAANLELITEKVAVRVLAEGENAVSTKTLLDAAEFNYKLSGLAAKQTGATPVAGFRVAFNFNAGRTGNSVTIEATPDVPLPDPPAHILSLKVLNDLNSEGEAI